MRSWPLVTPQEILRTAGLSVEQGTSWRRKELLRLCRAPGGSHHSRDTCKMVYITFVYCTGSEYLYIGVPVWWLYAVF